MEDIRREDIRRSDITQLAGWTAELAELVASIAGKAEMDTEAARADALARNIQHVADVLQSRAPATSMPDSDGPRPKEATWH